jgi:hypothetical protein
MRRPTKDPYARAIQTLERLHAELGGKILDNRQEAERLGEQMMHVEAVIKMLDPAYNLARITVKRRQANRWFKRGTLYRKALDGRAAHDRDRYCLGRNGRCRRQDGR